MYIDTPYNVEIWILETKTFDVSYINIMPGECLAIWGAYIDLLWNLMLTQ